MVDVVASIGNSWKVRQITSAYQTSGCLRTVDIIVPKIHSARPVGYKARWILPHMPRHWIVIVDYDLVAEPRAALRTPARESAYISSPSVDRPLHRPATICQI